MATIGLLRASDFAFPKDKAFPVPDCEHCDAALKVLEGYQAPGVKDAIIEALERRKASLKCSEQDADPDATEDADQVDELIPMDKINDLIDAYADALPGDDVVLEVTDETEDLLDDEDAAKKRPQDRPGGSNVGKHKTGPFCGPSGGAPKGSYPVNTRKRGAAALAFARHAPNPSGIKSCVCKHHPTLPACGKKKDGAEDLTAKMETLTAQAVELSTKLEQFQVDLESKDAQIEVQKEQLTVFEDDYRVLSEEIVALRNEQKNRLADRALELRLLGGENIEDVDAAREEFLAQEETEMRDAVGRLEDAFDFEGAAKRLNDGMAREPEGSVKDPTALTDGSGDDADAGQNSVPSRKDVMATYNRIHAQAGVKAAREFLDTVKELYGEHLEFKDDIEEDNNK